MQIASKRWHAFALAACMLVALAFGTMAAFAAGSWWSNPNGNTLNVKAVGDQYEDAFKADIATANVVVDVYKIATAEQDAAYETFTYDLIGDFAADNEMVSNIKGEWSADSWNELARLARQHVTIGEGYTQTAAAPAAISGLEDGLYLVLAHGDGVTSGTTATSAKYSYEFPPTIVALPSKNDLDASGAATSAASDGEWLTEVTIALKPEQDIRYGDILIEKRIQNVNEYSGEPATFVFHLKSTDGKYENYASVYYTGGASASTVVKHIPAGTVLTVEEVYSGGRYEQVSGDTAPKTIVAKSDPDSDDETPGVSVTFTNKSNDSGKGGHGIENNFTWDDSDWTWTPVPADETDNGKRKQESN